MLAFAMQLRFRLLGSLEDQSTPDTFESALWHTLGVTAMPRGDLNN
jgi:hypothetical protein